MKSEQTFVFQFVTCPHPPFKRHMDSGRVERLFLFFLPFSQLNDIELTLTTWNSSKESKFENGNVDESNKLNDNRWLSGKLSLFFHLLNIKGKFEIYSNFEFSQRSKRQKGFCLFVDRLLSFLYLLPTMTKLQKI